MASRRMFAKKIVLSDDFLDMPSSARCLYFTLNMFADDDGFVNNPKSIMRQSNASMDDMNVLIAKKYVIAFDTGVIVISHWRLHNYIKADRYHPTDYVDEKKSLSFDNTGAYTTDVEISTLSPECLQNGYPGKDRLGKDRVSKSNKDSIKDTIRTSEEVHATDEIKRIIDAWNQLPVNQVRAINHGTNRYKMLKARIAEHGIDAVLEAINLISQSPFLLGRVNDFVITFDWFIKPNNFIKVYEGNYSNNSRNTKQEKKGRLDWLDDLQ